MTATPRNVIGVDPGSLTGIVLWDNQEFKTVTELTGSPGIALMMLTDLVTGCIDAGFPPTLVIERFDISQDTLRKTREGIRDLINITGATWALAQRYELPHHEISRSSSKNFVSDDALRKRNLWPLGGHERDALRVALTFLATTANDDFIKFWAFWSQS